MTGTILLLLLGLQIKHFLADYVLQTGRMTTEKGNFAQPGGYAHAAIHVAGSLIVIFFVVPVTLPIVALLAAEFVVHYLIDYTKVRGSSNVKMAEQPKLFWSLHGLDQFLHQLTYLTMVTFVAYFPGA